MVAVPTLTANAGTPDSIRVLLYDLLVGEELIRVGRPANCEQRQNRDNG
jgi:hypothetical protein